MNAWLVISLFAIVESPALFWGLRGIVERGVAPSRTRPGTSEAMFDCIHRVCRLALIAWAGQASLLSAEDVGVRLPSSMTQVELGFAVYLLQDWTRGYLVPRGTAREEARRGISMLRMFCPRRPVGHLFVWMSNLVNPVTEEVIYRGVFVRLLWQASGSLPLALAVGLGTCLVVHHYQGWRFLLSHAVFFGVTTALVLSPFGLLSAITCHLLADTMPLARIGSTFRALKAVRCPQPARPPDAGAPVGSGP